MNNGFIHRITSPFYYIYRVLEFLFVKNESRLIPSICACAYCLLAAKDWILYGPPYPEWSTLGNLAISVIFLLIGYKVIHLICSIIGIISYKLFYGLACKHIETQDGADGAQQESAMEAYIARTKGQRSRGAKIFRN